MAQEKIELVRGLTLTDTTALVVGTVIGTGVFLKTAIMAQDVGSPLLVLGAWVAAGLLSLAGALTYAELGAMLPHAGGEYIYLRQAYGETTAFMFGWMRFAVAGSGSIAILGTGFATFLGAVFPLKTVWIEHQYKFLGQTINWRLGTLQMVAVAVILVFAAVNCLAVALGGKVQSALTVLKIAGIVIVVGGVFLFSNGASWDHLATPAGGAGSIGGVAASSMSRSITSNCLWMPTCGAARPMPWAVYMLRSMSRARSRMLSSTLLIRLALVRSSLEPSVWIGSGGDSSGCLGT